MPPGGHPALAPVAEDHEEGEARGPLRTAFAGLTTRGRSFLAAGVAAGICAYVLGQGELLRVGVLLAVLPLVAATVLFRTRHRVTGSRRLSPLRVQAGEEARVHLRVENVSRLTTGLLMLQDRVPYQLGPRPRFVLDRLEAAGRREVSYRVRSDMRGRFPLGPLQLRLSDPFGMCELSRSFSARDILTVLPAVVPLPAAGLGGQAPGAGGGRQRALSFTGEDDVIPRGYRHGDDLRRVHWRSTARYGELMVRREEQPRRSRCTVLLDTRRTAYAGGGPDSAFEWAVSGTASVLTHLLEREMDVRLLTDEGALDSVPGSGGFATARHEAAEAAGALLDVLAVIDHSAGTGLAAAHEVLHAGTEGLLVAFLGALDAEQTALLARARGRGASAVAFLLDGPEWGLPGAPERAEPDPEQCARALREAGWTVLRVPRGAALAELWRQAGTLHAGHAPGGEPGSAGTYGGSGTNGESAPSAYRPPAAPPGPRTPSPYERIERMERVERVARDARGERAQWPDDRERES